MPKPVRETTAPLSEAGTTTATGRMSVVAISAGVGSSGYYSPEVLEQAVADQLITRGTFLHLDHATEAESRERPGRSVTDIAGVFTGDATYDATQQAIVGEIQVFAPYRDLLTEMAPYVGLSISGSATDVTEGEHDGRRVPVIEGLAGIDSVDFVTRAGRGGRVVDLLESARVESRAVSHGISEATVNDTREALQSALRDVHASDDVWVWVRDFDDTTVWFDIESGDDAGTYAQGYTAADDGAVTLTGERTEVRATTTYVPVRPGGTTSTDPITQESEEDTMPKIQIEEAEHTRLVEQSGRVDALTQERDTAATERDEARRELAESRRTDAARAVLVAHEASFTPLEADGLLARMTVAEDGTLDAAAFKVTVDAAVAESRAAAGAGSVSGFGATTDQPPVTESATTPSRSAWGRPLTEQKGA